ncbi:hypothetical protein BDD12DRAFT_887015 [Trichophaea hybrida]|nr:hypothetical protein BDD12DRAFT_887015 [Trichophaea hybrida]
MVDQQVSRWPYLPVLLRPEYLYNAIHDLQELLGSMRTCPTGADRKWHEKVLCFLGAQVSDLEWERNIERIELSLQIAQQFMKGKDVAERIRKHEKLWIQYRQIPLSKQGKHAKVISLLDDRGASMAMDEYLSSVEKLANSDGLANVVTAYWKSIGDPEIKDKELASRTTQEWFKRRGYKWKVIKKGIYKDGNEQPDVMDYCDNIYLP